jgi:NAD(P)-dependent dehydrogenase (short-subunit alcohol dehydrogenase family)
MEVSMKRLEGKHALITGGTSGIGFETARAFLAEGATVALTGRSQDGLDKAKQELGPSVVTIRSDAGLVEDQASLASTLAQSFPKLDVLVSNAANVTHLPIEKWSEADFDATVAANLKGPFFLVRALLPLFSRETSIVLVGSVSAFLGHRDATVYGATKAGLLSMVRGLSYELKDRGIRVNGVSPGPTKTNVLNYLGAERVRELHAEFAEMVPIKRMGEPIEVAKAILYLASNESAYTVATVIRIDGGLQELAA